MDDVNTAIRKHIRSENVQIVGVAKDTDAITAALTGTGPTPIQYNSPKPQDVLDEDKVSRTLAPALAQGEDVTVVPVGDVFEH